MSPSIWLNGGQSRSSAVMLMPPDSCSAVFRFTVVESLLRACLVRDVQTSKPCAEGVLPLHVQQQNDAQLGPHGPVGFPLSRTPAGARLGAAPITGVHRHAGSCFIEPVAVASPQFNVYRVQTRRFGSMESRTRPVRPKFRSFLQSFFGSLTICMAGDTHSITACFWL